MHALYTITTTTHRTEITNLGDIQTDLSTNFVDVSGLGRVHEGFFEAEDVAHADVSKGASPCCNFNPSCSVTC